MTVNIEFTNIKIPSINQKYGYNPRSNKLYLTDEYRNFKQLIALKTRNERRILPPPYTVIISVMTYHDIDNAIKCILDGLKEGGCIDDDKNVLELHVLKRPVKRGVRNQLSITVKTQCARGEL